MASDDDTRKFLANLRIIKKYQSTLGRRQLFRSINRVLGDPILLIRSVREGLRGIYQHGFAVYKHYNKGVAAQFLQIFLEHYYYGTNQYEFYRYQFYLPDRRQLRTRHFPYKSHSHLPQLDLIERNCCPDYAVMENKSLFAARCGEVGLPTIPVLAEFADGQMVAQCGEAGGLPSLNLFSKRVDQVSGSDAKSWRYNGQKSFVNVATDDKLSAASLVETLSEQSRSVQIIVQKAVRNHVAMAPLTNGALSTIRIVTCRTPSGSLDVMPPVIRMPTGSAVVDNVAQGGLAAPVDLVTGKICGPAIRRDRKLGIIRTDKHPDTGTNLIGYGLPLWNQAVELAKQAHLKFPSLYFIGWDIAILQDHPIVVEGNATWCTDLIVLPHGISLADTQFIPYYNFHFSNSPGR